MLGSVSEADDAVQEAWIRLSRSDPGGGPGQIAAIVEPSTTARFARPLTTSSVCGERVSISNHQRTLKAPGWGVQLRREGPSHRPTPDKTAAVRRFRRNPEPDDNDTGRGSLARCNA
jgi:hypothetical protein